MGGLRPEPGTSSGRGADGGDRVTGWTLTVDCCGRPMTANAADKMHPVAKAKARAVWRDATTILARAQRIPRMERIAVTVQARYRTRRSPSDTDACAPSAKGCIDGLVVAQVIPDDTHEHVSSVTYLAPLLGTGLPDALILVVEGAAS